MSNPTKMNCEDATAGNVDAGWGAVRRNHLRVLLDWPALEDFREVKETETVRHNARKLMQAINGTSLAKLAKNKPAIVKSRAGNQSGSGKSGPVTEGWVK